MISGVAYERMLEDVRGRRRNAAAKEELGGDETIQRGREIGLLQRNDGRKQLVIKLAANAGADLCHLLCRAEPIEPSHQRIVQRCGYHHQRPIESAALAGVCKTSGFENGFRQFLRKERHALRPRLDLIEHFRGQLLDAGHTLDKGSGLSSPQPVQCEQRDMRKSGPGRRQLGPKRRDE